MKFTGAHIPLCMLILLSSVIQWQRAAMKCQQPSFSSLPVWDRHQKVAHGRKKSGRPPLHSNSSVSCVYIGQQVSAFSAWFYEHLPSRMDVEWTSCAGAKGHRCLSGKHKSVGSFPRRQDIQNLSGGDTVHGVGEEDAGQTSGLRGWRRHIKREISYEQCLVEKASERTTCWAVWQHHYAKH